MSNAVDPIDVRKPDGFYVVREVLRAAFFMRQAHLTINQAVIAAIREILSSTMGQNVSHIAGATGDWFPRTPQQLQLEIEPLLADDRKTINGTISISSDPDVGVPDYYLEYNGFALDKPLFRNRASFMFVWMPAEVFYAKRSETLDLILRIASTLPISNGHADLALVGNQLRKQQLGRRYVGLDISDVSATAIDLSDKASGSYWLTLYGGGVAERLGPVGQVRKELPASTNVFQIREGKIGIMLSEMPRRGDRNRRAELPEHVALAKLLNARGIFHVPTKTLYFEDEDTLADADLQSSWHRRFLDGEW